MDVSVEQLLLIIGEQYVKILLLEKRVKELEQLIEEQAKQK